MSLSKFLQWGKRKILLKKVENNNVDILSGSITFENNVATVGNTLITSTMAFMSSGVSPGFVEDFIFRGQESITKDIFMKRIEKFRKKYPEHANCLEIMKEKAYSKQEEKIATI